MLTMSPRWACTFLLLSMACSGGGDQPAPTGGYAGDFLGGFLGRPGGGGAAAGGAGGARAISNPATELPKYMGRIVVTPSAVLFTKSGERALLRAEAFDAAGQKIAATLTWESSRSAEVAVDASGQVTSMTDLGSSQIRVRAGSLSSPPVMVLVAEPPAGAVLVSDAQVTAGPTLADATTTGQVGTRLKLTVTGVGELKPGTVLLAREGKPVGGRVVSATAGAGGHLDVVLETIPLLQLFKRLRAEERYIIDGVALAEHLAAPPKPAMAARPGNPRVDTIRQAARIGPLECETQLMGSAITGDVNIRLVPDVDLSRRFVIDNGVWLDLLVKLEGKLTLSGTATLTFAPMLIGTASCELILYRMPIAVGGPLAAIASFQVPLGVGGELVASIGGVPLSASLELRGESKLIAGFHYVHPGPAMDLGSFSNKFEMEPKFTLPSSELPFAAKASVALGGLTGLDLGFTYFGDKLKLLKVSLMLKAQAELGAWKTQTDLGGFASNYDLKPVLEAGPGEHVAKAMEWLGGAVALKPAISAEGLVIAESPRGTFKADRMSTMPNMPVRLDVDLKPGSVKFLGLDNVQNVQIWQLGPGMPEPKIVQTIPGSPGRTSFPWTWTPSITDVGTTLFWAGSNSKLASPILKVDTSPPLMIRVSQRRRWRGMCTHTQTGGGTVVSAGSTTTYSLEHKITVEAEHESDLLAAGGTMKITKLQASHTYSQISTSMGGTRDCPVTLTSDFGESSTASMGGAGTFATLIVREDTGQYQMGSFLGQAPGRAHHVNTTTSSGGTGCPASKMESFPREFEGSWGCGGSGNFEPGGDSLGGEDTTKLMKNYDATATTTWKFTRILD